MSSHLLSEMTEELLKACELKLFITMHLIKLNEITDHGQGVERKLLHFLFLFNVYEPVIFNHYINAHNVFSPSKTMF